MTIPEQIKQLTERTAERIKRVDEIYALINKDARKLFELKRQLNIIDIADKKFKKKYMGKNK
jgi:hypothetical protein